MPAPNADQPARHGQALISPPLQQLHGYVAPDQISRARWLVALELDQADPRAVPLQRGQWHVTPADDRIRVKANNTMAA
jgi:hypothetical protein